MLSVKNSKWLLAGLMSCCLAAGASYAFEEHGQDDARRGEQHGRGWDRTGRGEVLDNRYNHGHYYPRRGAVVRDLPAGYRPYWYHDRRYFFADGIWYLPGPYGFVVSDPPVGLVLPMLPPFYSTVWLGGVPFYYANNVYYQWSPGASGYTVVAPPPGADQPQDPGNGPPPDNAGPPPGYAPAPTYAPAPAPSAPAADGFYMYPRTGQSATQQAADRYECSGWARSQTGFEGSRPDLTPEQREQFHRAITACLEARGYSVR